MRLRPRIRLHILTGFLGSGKSTLLRRCLRDHKDRERIGVLINEYGVVAIDHTLVRGVSPHARAIAGGCACCSADPALRKTLIEILAERELQPDSALTDIVLETSGVADPARIIGTIRDDMNLAEYVEVASCITTIEACADPELVARFPEARNQIACADWLVLTKADLADTSVAEQTATRLREINPLARIVTAGEFELNTPIDRVGSTIPMIHVPAPARHSPALTSFHIDAHPGLQWPAFSVWLTAVMHRHGDAILRFKGVIPLERADRALVLQSVRHRVSPPEHLDLTPPQQTDFGLVFICDGVTESKVRESLTNFAELIRSDRYALS